MGDQKIIFSMVGVKKSYGPERQVLKDIYLSFFHGAKIGILGPNGVGKTTSRRLIVGQESPDQGKGTIGETVVLGYVDQNWPLDSNKNVWEEFSDGQETILLGKHELNSRAYVSRFNFTGNDQQKKVGELSGGERNRVHLAKMLRGGPTSFSSTNRPATLMSTRCGRSKQPLLTSLAAPSSFRTIAGSLTVWRRTSSPSRATAAWSGSRATTRPTKRIAAGVWVSRPTRPVPCDTSN